MEETTRSSIWYAFCYLLFNGLISGVIAGSSEFGIAYGMYWNSKYKVTLWAFPNTLSGDCALTHFIQAVVTWYIEEVLVGWDALKGNTPIILFAQKSLPKNRFVRWYFEVSRGIIVDEEEVDNNTLKNYLKRQFIGYPQKSFLLNICDWLFRKTIRGLGLGAVIWVVEWPVAMGIMAGTGDKISSVDYIFHDYYPETMKLIYGFVLGLILTPIIILVVILRDQWYRLYIQHVEPSEGLISMNLEENIKKGGVYARLQEEPESNPGSSKDRIPDASLTV